MSLRCRYCHRTVRPWTWTCAFCMGPHQTGRLALKGAAALVTTGVALLVLFR